MLVAPRSPAREEVEVGRFIAGLKRPVVLDIDAQRKRAKNGKLLVDELIIYALRDSDGRRFCVSDYRRYGEQQQGLFVILPRPVEEFGWGGLRPARHSAEEKLVAELLAEAMHSDAKAFLAPLRE